MALFSKDTPKKKNAPTGRTTTKRARTASLHEGTAHSIIRAPWFSEKALVATEKGVYTFEVPKSATKAQIAGAVKEIFGVTPRKVRIVHLPGKVKAMRTQRGYGVRAARHKAYVYVAEGESIQLA